MDQLKDRYFFRNVAGVSLVEFFWGLGFPIVLESTFLQLFLKHLGASSFLIGLVPSIFVIGISCFPLFSSYLSRNLVRKRGLVIILHLVSALSILFFGLILLAWGKPEGVLPIFFISYALFSICIGLTIPVWLNYLVRIFSESRTVPGLGYMMLCQNIAKVLSSFLILGIVERYSFSVQASGWIFIGAGCFFLMGSLGFLINREIVEDTTVPADNTSFLVHTRTAFKEIVTNKKFLIFLAAADIEFTIILTSLSFYANYATSYYQVSPAIAAGAFVACIYGGSITVNILLGAMNLLQLREKFILSKILTLIALILLCIIPGYLTFFLVSYMLGFVRAIRNMVYPPSVKQFATREDTTSYFALGPFLTLPLTVGYPLAFGKTLDLLEHLGAAAYKTVFGFSATIACIALFLAFRTDYQTGTQVKTDQAADGNSHSDTTL
ncbi:MAG: MFS transporter [Desulfobulbaceae bacterium]|nr:MAG: MFS transporter [Desulfobulbaceae bacterium]